MFSHFNEMRERREGGFTLIELLVVILIIAILAAIAIPVFLNQRKKGWISQMDSALRNALTAEESYLTANDTYTSVEADLEGEGWKKADQVEFVQATFTTGEKFCVEVQHTQNLDADEEPRAISSDETRPQAGTCAVGGDLDPYTAP